MASPCSVFACLRFSSLNRAADDGSNLMPRAVTPRTRRPAPTSFAASPCSRLLGQTKWMRQAMRGCSAFTAAATAFFAIPKLQRPAAGGDSTRAVQKNDRRVLAAKRPQKAQKMEAGLEGLLRLLRVFAAIDYLIRPKCWICGSAVALGRGVCDRGCHRHAKAA